MRFWSARVSLVATALLAACGGRADRDRATGGEDGGAGGTSGSSAPGGAAGSSSAGRGGFGVGGSKAGAGGAVMGGGTAGSVAIAGSGGSGGAGGSSPTPDLTGLVGDYDLFVEEPPAVAGCGPDWFVPRLNFGVTQTEEGALVANGFADFQWAYSDYQEMNVEPDAVVIAATTAFENMLLTPDLVLYRTEQGFSGGGFAEIPYSCDGALPTTRQVMVTIEPDTTPPKLHFEPLWPRQGPAFPFSRFDFDFSEPVVLPSGDYKSWFEEPADGAGVAELWDVDTGDAFAAGWRSSLAGPVTVANFAEPALAEGRSVSLRIVGAASDRAGNPLLALGEQYGVWPAAAFTTQIDFDDGVVPGIYGNATYHAQPGPDAPCEQGGCLELSGLVCGDQASASMFAVRFPDPWDYPLVVRYRVWASTQFIAPLQVIYASGCMSEFSPSLSALAEPDGSFTHISPWTDDGIAPCGGPDIENGFVIALGCAQGADVPEVRVVIEHIAASDI